MRDTKTQDFFPKFGHPQRMPTSPLWSSKRDESLSTLIHSEGSPRSSSVSTIKSHKGEGNTNSPGSTTTLVTPRQPSPSRGTNPKSNEHMKIVGVVLEMKIKSVTQESGWSLGSLELNEAWRRGWEHKRVSQSVCNVKWVANRAREVWGAFIAPPPPRESSRWSVRNPDMSESGAGHDRPTSLETGLGTRYVRSGT
jgi:hypothetical protein